MRPPSWKAIAKEAATRFGVADFRPGQREVIRHVLAGKDVLAIMPTGAGKSLCYQLPALFLPNRTVVVSPLISLMQDQQEKLEEIAVDAVKLDSTLTRRRERETLEEMEEGEHRIVYVTPERLEHPENVALLRARGVSLFVVDEAHCVSQWGHDFRPAYLGLRDAVAALGGPPVLAVTATATPEVAADIRQQLRMEDAVTINTGTERPNLFLEVFRTTSGLAKRKRLLRYFREERGCGIVYTATVRVCNELHAWLEAGGVAAGKYHGRLPARAREEAQEAFMHDRYQVIVATNAFGLGIDKPDIRFVVHYHFPDSLETYYQEAGRAGRDGAPAKAALFYQLEDRRIQAFFLGGKYPRREESLQLYETLRRFARQSAKPIGFRTLVASTELSERRCKVIVAQLESAGVLARTARGVKLLHVFLTATEEASIVRYLDDVSIRAKSQTIGADALQAGALLVCSYQFGLRPSLIAFLRVRDVRIWTDTEGSTVHLTFKMLKQRSASAAFPLTRRVKREWTPIFNQFAKRCGRSSLPGSDRFFDLKTVRQVSESISNITESICGRRIYPTALRHAAAQRLVDAGASKEELASFMGHEDLDTGLVYFRASLSANMTETASLDLITVGRGSISDHDHFKC